MRILLLMLLSFSSFAQTNYYSVDPVTGYKTKIGYSETVNSPKPIEFSPYVPQYDLDAYKTAILSRQQQYDRNVASVQEIVTATDKITMYLVDNSVKGSDDLRNSFLNYMNALSRTNLDYSNYKVYRTVFGNIKDIYDQARQLQ